MGVFLLDEAFGSLTFLLEAKASTILSIFHSLFSSGRASHDAPWTSRVGNWCGRSLLGASAGRSLVVAAASIVRSFALVL